MDPIKEEILSEVKEETKTPTLSEITRLIIPTTTTTTTNSTMMEPKSVQVPDTRSVLSCRESGTETETVVNEFEDDTPLCNAATTSTSTSTSKNDSVCNPGPPNPTRFCTRYVTTSTQKTHRGYNFLERGLESDSSEEEQEPQASDNLLGRLRNGIKLIQTHARETMAKCDTDAARTDMAQRLETSTLGMLRAEKSVLSTTRIIAEVVDEFVSDYEDDDKECQKDSNNMDGNSLKDETDPVNKSDSVIPIIYRNTLTSSKSLRNFGCKISKIMQERQANFEESLTDELLMREQTFRDLRQQITFGEQDSRVDPAASSRLQQLGSYSLNSGGWGDTRDTIDLPQLTLNMRLEPKEDVNDCDEAVLPSTDPITSNPIEKAVRNRHCNHIFDEQSITQFLSLNFETARCPVFGCKNERTLKLEDFIHETDLTDRIRTKNAKTNY